MTKSKFLKTFLWGAFVLGLATVNPIAVMSQETSGQASSDPQRESKVSKSVPTPSSASSSTATSSASNSSNVREGTRIDAALESQLDARSAKTGDEVMARVTKNVKDHGRTVIRKGDHLVGRVTNVKVGGNANASSQLAVTFDRLVQGTATTQLNTVVSAVLATPREEQAQREEMAEPMPTPASPASTGMQNTGRNNSTTSGGTGLLGGVTSTVNSTVTSTTHSATNSVATGVESTVNSTLDTHVGSLTGSTIATPRRSIHIGSEAQADQHTGLNSVFTTRHGDLRMDSGTSLQFRVVENSAVKKGPIARNEPKP